MNAASGGCMMKYFSWVTKEKKMIKMLRTGLLREHLLSVAVSEPLLNRRLYSACSNTVARIHLHKQGNYAEKPRATQWNHPNTTKTRTCSKSGRVAAAPQLPTYHLQTSGVVPRALPTLQGEKNTHIPYLCTYIP